MGWRKRVELYLVDVQHYCERIELRCIDIQNRLNPDTPNPPDCIDEADLQPFVDETRRQNQQIKDSFST